MPHTHIHFHAIHTNFSLPEKVKHTLIFSVIRVILYAVVNLYIPIFIYEKFGFIWMCIYLIFHFSIFAIISTFIVKKLITKKGVEFCQFLSIVVGALQILLINFAFYSEWMIIVIAFLGALSLESFWLSRHLVLGLYSKREKTTEEFAIVNNITSFLGIVFPILFALLITTFGYKLFFLVFTIVVVLITIIIFKKMNIEKQIELPEYENKPKISFLPLFLADGLRNATDFMVGLLIYIVIKDIVVFGGLNSVVSLVGIIVTMILARFIDKKHDYALGTIGFLLRANIYTILFFMLDGWSVAIANILLGLSTPLLFTPYFGFYYTIIRKYGAWVAFQRERAVAFMRGVIFLCFAFLEIKYIILLTVIGYIIAGILYYSFAIKEEFYEIITSNSK